MADKINFTKDVLRALAMPEKGKRAVYLDSKQIGLQVRVTDTGAKTFSVYRRTKNGRPERITLGKFPTMTVEQARQQAARINADIEDGANPAHVRRAQREAQTFGELFEEYGARHGKLKRSWKADVSIYTNHLEHPLAARKLADVTRSAIAQVLSSVRAKGLTDGTVNNVRALISGLFSKAIEWGYVTSNPVSSIKTLPKHKRDRFLQATELPRFFQAVADEPSETMRDYVLLALLTGARRANLLAMRWPDISLPESVWRIPRTKNGTPQNVTLSPEAVAILKARREAATAGAGYVFPGTGVDGHIVEPKKAVVRIMQRAGIPYGRKAENGVTLHDLRRTLGSWQAKTGASLAIIGKSLNHRSQQTTAIYARLDLDPVRASVNTATAAMMAAGGMRAPAEVVPLPKKQAGT